jgi:hypothetical protein
MTDATKLLTTAARRLKRSRDTDLPGAQSLRQGRAPREEASPVIGRTSGQPHSLAHGDAAIPAEVGVAMREVHPPTIHASEKDGAPSIKGVWNTAEHAAQ